MRIGVRVHQGQDIGQNFGTLFEAPTPDGTAVVGAGFQGLYNTYHRVDRHVIQFFIRPTSGEVDCSFEPLPRPTGMAGTYLFDLDGIIYSSSEDVRYWDEPGRVWKADISEARGRMRLGSGVLSFDEDNAEYDGRRLLSPPRWVTISASTTPTVTCSSITHTGLIARTIGCIRQTTRASASSAPVAGDPVMRAASMWAEPESSLCRAWARRPSATVSSAARC